MYKNTFKNKAVNKIDLRIKHITDLIVRGESLKDFSTRDSGIREDAIDEAYFFGWKSSVESFLSSLNEKSFYKNFKENVKMPAEDAVNIGISILSNCRDNLRSNLQIFRSVKKNLNPINFIISSLLKIFK